MSTMDITGLMANSNTATSKPSGEGLAGITGADFMNVLIKQLQMQDPFQPMTNQEMIQQLSSIRELEMNTRISGKLEQLTDQQRFGSAAALIGKKVSGVVTDSGGTAFPMQGVVTSIRFTNSGDVMLELDSDPKKMLPIAALQTVQDNVQTSATTTNESATTSKVLETTARSIATGLLSAPVNQPVTANVSPFGIPLGVGVSTSVSQPISTTRTTNNSVLQRMLNDRGI